MKVTQIVLESRPQGVPTTDNFSFEEVTLLPIGKGEVLLKPLFVSVDPYIRGRMNDQESYIPSFKLGEPITTATVAVVEESNDTGFKKGDTVIGMLPWATLSVKLGDKLRKIETKDVPIGYYLGVLGMPGLTAYFGMTDICNPKPGETVVVSGAAGAVGLVAGQIAKIRGCHVVGITGSDEKVRVLKSEFDFDEAINYKTVSNLQETIARACPKKVDCYFDNIGGDISDAVIANLNFNARIAISGQIALYNEINLSTGIRILPKILMNSASVQGFMVGNYSERFKEGLLQLSQWVHEGKLRYTETVIDGFKYLPKAFIGLFNGNNIGKMIVKVN